MPHGYSKQYESGKNCKWCKVHRNGDETKVDIEKLRGEWQAAVEDAGRTKKLGTYTSKAEAKTAAENWMKQHPKGLQSSGFGGGGTLPGLNGAQNSNDFWG